MTEQKKPAAPPEWVRDAVAAEPKGFMADIIQASRQRSNSASLIPDRMRSDDKPRPVSGGTTELKGVPGIDAMDRIAAGFAYQDRMAALKVKVETDWLEYQLEQAKGAHVEHEYDPFDREHLEK